MTKDRVELHDILRQHMAGGLSRRDLLGRALALAAASAGGFSLMPGPARASEPKRGGSVKFGFSDASQQDTLDPGTWPASFAQTAFNGSMCNNMTEITADGKLVGDIAESFEPADGGQNWVFKIRKGIAFHDGKALTMDDLKASYHHHMGEKSTSGAKSLMSVVQEIVADGDNLIFKLKSKAADFPWALADYHLSIMPAASNGALDWKRGVGTGPFILESFVPGSSVKMRRNPNYHKNNKPYFDEVEFLAIMDQNARTNAFLTGEVDFINDVDVKTIPLFEGNPDIDLLRIPSLRHFSFDMDCSVAPFNDPNVRMALKLALDRDDVIRKIFLGEARKGNDNPVADLMPFHSDPKPQHAYDPNKAREYLRKAGLEALSVNLHVSEAAFPGAVDAAALYQQHAAKAGITINVVREADDGYWENIWLKKPFNACDWYGRATCDWLFSTIYAKGASWNNTHWSNERFNELLMAARGEIDESARNAQYAEMQQLIHDDGGFISVAFVNWLYGSSKRLGHPEVIGGIFPHDNLRITERWWVA